MGGLVDGIAEDLTTGEGGIEFGGEAWPPTIGFGVWTCGLACKAEPAFSEAAPHTPTLDAEAVEDRLGGREDVADTGAEPPTLSDTPFVLGAVP